MLSLGVGVDRVLRRLSVGMLLKLLVSLIGEKMRMVMEEQGRRWIDLPSWRREGLLSSSFLWMPFSTECSTTRKR